MIPKTVLAAMAALLLALVPPVFARAAEHTPGEFEFRVPKGATSAQVKGWIRQASAKHGLDPCLVQALIEIESGGDQAAVSPKGAQGLMQIMPGTARDLKLDDPFDPTANIDAGSRYLREQLRTFGDVRLALAAYNAGPEAVRKFAGVPPYPETQRYVAAVANRFIVLKTGGNMEAFVKKVLEGANATGKP
ncbi:lytic transglycosylase domain-containing protein [Fundidesulfovibrio terrae]|uniref:lytic transglycosylase domain-containing protein n=1 Tax=Fundidesulfovibrio terrae TaxID=2922866 RepID=UPI001FAEDE19|nr:lytic transglycosylase domain-containing protein [Fundidesulfovibrio terrae]